ncbi:ankyrin repeat domain-containing protein [Echinicola sp. CAU 1574]|uniref:Ankyrin repeat domain-containing protein n=1 Tax=Echinicola arenosa TaxID=2774144 RepID=A0ABR9AMT0_9BACT|nr:ankyrin repeat domain-containing protein [Echinicola arenosa]MBD8489200.1 ankyrin repeat domain-containing protein [Echinicola arenosa]
MKTLKNSSLAVLLSLVLAVLLSSCGNNNGHEKNKSGMEKPEMNIHSAVLNGNLEIVRQHIKAGTNIDEIEPMSGSTPLISAATFGKTAIAQALIAAGADLTISNKEGTTPLHAAAFFCRVEIVQLLVDVNADRTLKNNFGATPRETVMGPFSEIKPIYEMIQQQLAPLGMQLDMEQLEKTRPVIAMMLQ